MQIDYTVGEGENVQFGQPDHPVALAKKVLTHETGLPEREHRLRVSIDGEETPVHMVRFPVTGDEWDCVNGFRGKYSAARKTWVWQLAGLVLGLLLAAVWYLLL